MIVDECADQIALHLRDRGWRRDGRNRVVHGFGAIDTRRRQLSTRARIGSDRRRGRGLGAKQVGGSEILQGEHGNREIDEHNGHQ